MLHLNADIVATFVLRMKHQRYKVDKYTSVMHRYLTRILYLDLRTKYDITIN